VELVEPILKLSSPPAEFKALIKFLNTNSEALAGSPMLFATMPAKPGLPQAIVAIDLPSIEEAQKFEPKLQRLLPVIFPTPSPTPSPTPPPTSSPTPASVSSPEPKADEKNATVKAPAPAVTSDKTSSPSSPTTDEKKEPAAPPFQIKRSGSLILISDTTFTFKNLRPDGSKLLSEDQNFRLARDRFPSEPLFIYYNVGLEDERAKQFEKEMAAANEKALAEVEEKPEATEPTVETKAEESPTPPSGEPEESPEPEPAEEPMPEPPVMLQVPPSDNGSTPQPPPNPSDPFLSSLAGAIGWGPPAWPEAVGLAVAFENEAYVIRVLLIDPPDTKTSPVPFIPQIISGRPAAATAPSVMPADTEFFSSVSLDLPRMYTALLENMQKMNTNPAAGRAPIGNATAHVDTAPTEAAFEKKYGFKIREELLPALGNEIAVGGTLQSLGLANTFAMPAPAKSPTPADKSTSQLTASTTTADETAQTGPVFLVGVKDRDAVKALIPRLLDAMGMKALTLLAQTERRDDTELVTYAGAFSYAFVDSFLVLSPSVAGVRHVVDAYVNHETLASNTNFRNLTRWQPRETQGQFYIAPSVVAGYHDLAHNPNVPMDPAMRDFVAKLSPAPEAVSYALTNEGFGPLHELHLPKNLVLMMVAGISATTTRTPMETNEDVAKGLLYSIASAERAYKDGKGKGSYGTLDQLAAEHLIPAKEIFNTYGYKFEANASGTKFEATATPKEYGTSGRLSFFVDETNILRGGDRGGAVATAADGPIP